MKEMIINFIKEIGFTLTPKMVFGFAIAGLVVLIISMAMNYLEKSDKTEEKISYVEGM